MTKYPSTRDSQLGSERVLLWNPHLIKKDLFVLENYDTQNVGDRAKINL